MQKFFFLKYVLICDRYKGQIKLWHKVIYHVTIESDNNVFLKNEISVKFDKIKILISIKKVFASISFSKIINGSRKDLSKEL